MTDFPADEQRDPANWTGDHFAGPDTPQPVSATEPLPVEPQPVASDSAASVQVTSAPAQLAEFPPAAAPSSAEPQLFQSFTQPPPRPLARVPHLGHLLLMSALGLIGFVCAVVVIFIAMHFHFLGWDVSAKSATDIRLILTSEGVLYLVTFGLCMAVFPHVWNRGFFAGVHWRGEVALQRFWFLAGTAAGCLTLAILDEWLMPGPSGSPIEKMLRTPGAAWLMFGFGITIAPFFEEMFFRGFLLPTLCTACDWVAEKVSVDSQVRFVANGRPVWSTNAVSITAVMFVGFPACLYVAWYAFSTGRLSLGLFVFGIVLPIAAILFGFLLVIATRRSPSREPILLLDENGHPQWSLNAMVIASILTSLPFALLHVEQQGHSLGPFLLLIAVSLVLCTVRLATRSLAASTLVHACYNFMIFTLALIGTGGFRHFDKM